MTFARRAVVERGLVEDAALQDGPRVVIAWELHQEFAVEDGVVPELAEELEPYVLPVRAVSAPRGSGRDGHRTHGRSGTSS